MSDKAYQLSSFNQSVTTIVTVAGYQAGYIRNRKSLDLCTLDEVGFRIQLVATSMTFLPRANIFSCFLCLSLTALLTSNVSWSQADLMPVCPGPKSEPNPVFPVLGEDPEFIVWRNLSSLDQNCVIQIQSVAQMTVAVSAHFTHSGTVDDIAAKIGKVSAIEDLTYWSVTDNDWRRLFSKAIALDSPNTKSIRSDFTAREVLSGDVMYVAQNDTRSWGLNLYSYQTIDSSPRHMVFQSQNLSPIKLGPVTLLEPLATQSIVFVTQVHKSLWSYYSLAIVKKSAITPKEKSLVNRQAAFLRFLIGQAPEKYPPLAR